MRVTQHQPTLTTGGHVTNEFFDKWIDYAGLFPPAKRLLPDAVQEFEQHLTHAHAGMLSRFVLPVGQLAEFGNLATIPSLPVAVLLSGALTYGSWLELVMAEVNQVKDRKHAESLVSVQAIELPIPKEDFVATRHTRILTQVTKLLLGLNLQIFLEIPCVASARKLADILPVLPVSSNPPGFPCLLGMKLRTGGVTPSAVPLAGDIACFIQLCVDHHRISKVTAGLHQPFTHFDQRVGCDLYGFFNVFCAWMLVSSREISPRDLETVLLEKDPKSFQFSAHGMQVLGHTLTNAQIAHCRQKHLQSVGSCSFTEPVAALTDAGLLTSI
jgi:hypothetical protein